MYVQWAQMDEMLDFTDAQLCMCGGMRNSVLVATGVCAITHRRGLVACSSDVFGHTSRLSDECMLSLCICGYVVCV